jgi:carboxyl-terminal processing protease
MEMTLRAVDGKEKRVMLRKEKLESEGTVVQSFILQGGIKTGYIYLPDFYTRWDDELEGGRCANDVAKEIIKLKKEGVEGLILDLRFNGGGSLYEARAMAGIFIDEGPLAMVRGRDKKTVSLKDLHRGTVYDGPLVIMVNGGSASASEVLAASIQDYNRGLIVGSQTYGKATSQNILPLGGLPSSASSKKIGEGNMGYVKVTTQRLYRLTGKSAQGRGVTPDVVIPDIFRVLDVSEREYPFVLQPDSIPTNIYYKPLLPVKRKELRARSQERLSKNSAFQELQKTITWLEGEMKKSAPEPLLWENYLAATAEASKHQINADLYFESQEKIYEVSAGPGKDERLTVDDYARQINERWMQILTGDLYLKETYQILRDHILLTKNP